MPRKAHAPRNYTIAKGVMRYSRSAMYHKKGKWAVKNRANEPKKVEGAVPIEKTFGKKKPSKRIVDRSPRFYPTEDIKRPLPSSRHIQRPTRLRKSITPGTVLIILAGKHAGKRVVFIKQLASGLLLVTGPFKLNGVPIQRVNQAYVIATSTKVDISSLKVDEKYNDSYFVQKKEKKKSKKEGELFVKEEEKKEVNQERVADQKAFDTPLLEIIQKTPHLKEYIASRFTLGRGQFPHQMKF